MFQGLPFPDPSIVASPSTFAEFDSMIMMQLVNKDLKIYPNIPQKCEKEQTQKDFVH